MNLHRQRYRYRHRHGKMQRQGHNHSHNHSHSYSQKRWLPLLRQHPAPATSAVHAIPAIPATTARLQRRSNRRHLPRRPPRPLRLTNLRQFSLAALPLRLSRPEPLPPSVRPVRHPRRRRVPSRSISRHWLKANKASQSWRSSRCAKRLKFSPATCRRAWSWPGFWLKKSSPMRQQTCFLMA